MGFRNSVGVLLSISSKLHVVVGARVRTEVAGLKTIAGVPIVNYEQAYVGQATAQDSATGLEEDWIVMLDDSATDEQISALCASTTRGCEVSGSPSEDGVPFFKVQATEAELETVLQRADEAAPALFVEVDVPEYGIPDMPEDGDGDGEVTTAAATWGLNKIEVDRRSTRGRGVNVYILDTGIRITHEDFGGRAFKYLDVTSGSLVTCSSSSSSCAADRHGHGTHCASTATGSTYGVADRARVYAAKVLGDSGSGSRSGICSAVDRITSKSSRPAVISMSLGGVGVSSSYRTTIDKATSGGVVVVVAAGNENMDACGCSPAFVKSAITVGSSTSRDAKSGFSSWGPCVEIWAPGSSITAARHDSSTGTTRKSGTSMACPHVSGAAALVLEASPSRSPSGVLRDLKSAAFTDKLSGLKSSDTNKLLRVKGVR